MMNMKIIEMMYDDLGHDMSTSTYEIRKTNGEPYRGGTAGE